MAEQTDKFTWNDDDFDRLFAHPLLSYFGPARPSWRRILVIGQEPAEPVNPGETGRGANYTVRDTS